MITELDAWRVHLHSDQLRRGWKSPVYQFFNKVSVRYEGTRKYHFFHCGAPHCKGKVSGVRRFLDTGDRAATGNLKTHANNCWGEDVVSAAMNGVKIEGRDGYIFAAFACQGQQPVNVTHRTHTNMERR